MLTSLQQYTASIELPYMLIIGGMTILSFYAGRSMRFLRLPSIIGFMLCGVILGPSAFNLLSEALQEELAFITDIALGFVALSIGMELSLRALRSQGIGMLIVILSESFLAFLLVTGGVWALTRDLPLALIFGAIAPASAPAGTVAVIQEYKARGNLTQALYAVVGFDDGLGIVIFGFAAAFARSMLAGQAGMAETGLVHLILVPFKEVFLSLFAGGLLAMLFVVMTRRTEDPRNLLVHTFGIVLLTTGICEVLHLSLILTHMVIGLVLVNTQPVNLLERVRNRLTEVMPLLFVLFFALAGANLHVYALPALGTLGVVYIACRSAGLMGGAWLGATWGKLEDKIRRYLGLGILSQAGVAIGLSLIVKQEFAEFGQPGIRLGATVLTSITATCIFFEIIGPILTKIALTRAREIRP